MAERVHALRLLPIGVALVLHDVHKLAAPAALAALDALLGAHPAGVRLRAL